MTVKEAAPLLGMSEQYLRDLMRFNLIDIGIATRLPGKSQYHYIIYPDKVNKLLKGNEENGKG